MSKDNHRRKLVENEIKAREKNAANASGIKTYFRNSREVTRTPMEFACECSDKNCDKHIAISIEKYEALHKRDDQFIIHPGHDTPAVENVAHHKDDFDVAEKPSLKP